MHLSRLAIYRPVTTLMFSLALVFLGIVSYRELAVQQYPDLTMPAMSYSVRLIEGQHSPEETNKKLSIPFEKMVASLPGVMEMKSWTHEGAFFGYARFTRGTDMDFRVIELQDRAGKWKRGLNDEIEYNVDLWSTDEVAADLAELVLSVPEGQQARVATVTDKVERRLKSIDGISRVEISGRILPNIMLETDRDELVAHGLSVDGLINKINQYSQDQTLLGTLREGNRRHAVKLRNEINDLDDVLKIPVDDNGLFTVATVADSSPKTEEEDAIFRVNGKQAVGVSIKKERDRNTIRMARMVRKRVEELNAELPPGFEVTITHDAAESLERLIKNLTKLASVGALLAMLVLLVFVRSWRVAAIVCIAIPTSIIFTFNAMYAAGISINLISLLGLAIGIGMLVDGAIVVVENVFRHSRLIGDPREAAWFGSREVTYALIISTATTLVVFLPLMFLDNDLVLIMRKMTLSVVFPMTMSLLVAITLIPMLASKVLAGRRQRVFKLLDAVSPLVRLNPWQRPHRLPRNILKELVFFLAKASIRHPVRLFFTIMIVLALTFIASSIKVAVQKRFGDEKVHTVKLYGRLPLSTTLDEADEIFRKKEREVRAFMAKDDVVKSFTSKFKKEGGEIRIRIADEHQHRPRQEFIQYFDDLKEGNDNHGFRFRAFPDLAAASALAQQAQEAQGNGAEKVLITGENFEAMIESAEQVKEYIEDQSETAEVFIETPRGRPEVIYKPNIELFRIMQADTSALQSFFRARNDRGTRTSMIIEEEGVERRVTIKVKEPSAQVEEIATRQTLAELRKTRLPLLEGGSAALETLGTFSIRHGAPPIQKNDRQRNMVVSFNFNTSYSNPQREKDRQEILHRIQGELNIMRLAPGVSARLSGTLESVNKQQLNFKRLIGLAILFAYLVMAFFFESFVSPLVILFTLPLAWIGGIWGIILLNTNLDQVAMFGSIMLVGLVVNNGILLVDYTRKMRREKGYRRQRALMAAVAYRLRPILMTSLTTILGLLPILLSKEAEKEARSLVSVLIGGYISSAALTLVVIPTMYNLFDSSLEKFGGLVRRKRLEFTERFRRSPLSAPLALLPQSEPRPEPKTTTIVIDNISKIYPLFNKRKLLNFIPSRTYHYGCRPTRGNTALDQISLEIGAGMFGLLGPNGAGKSTLMQILTGIIPCSYGSINLLGHDLATNRHRIRHLISYLPQNFGVYGSLSLVQYLNFFAPYYDLHDEDERRRKIEEVVELVSLSAVRHKPMKSLSGGMRQRAGIAQLLLNPRPIMIVDEPTAGLDPVERVRFRLLLSQLAQSRIVILSTHIVDDITSSCKQVAVLNRGELIYQGGLERISSLAANLVWDVELPADQNMPIDSSRIIYRKHVGDRILYHYVSEEPLPGSVLVDPNFEDAYVALLMQHNLGKDHSAPKPLAAV